MDTILQKLIFCFYYPLTNLKAGDDYGYYFTEIDLPAVRHNAICATFIAAASS